METLQPKLRFPGFEGDWVEKRIDEIAPLQRGFDLPVNNIVEGNFPVVFSNGIMKRHNEYKAIAPGVVTGRSGTIGKLTYIEENYWPHNTSLWVTDFKNNFPKFIYYFYLQFDLTKYSSGSGVPTLNRNDVHNQIVSIPFSEEQTRIANFLSSVDEKLNLLKEKKNLLEDYKKGMMQKIFNQEIRFKDDNGNDFEDWEETTLGDICEFENGKAHENEIDENGDFIVVNSKFVSTNGRVRKYTNKIISRLDKKDIVMVMSDVPNGKAIAKCYYIEENNKYSLNQRICKIRIVNNVSKYIY